MAGDGFTFLDPGAHGLLNPEDYMRWDLGAIRKSDAVLAYMESSNPSGYGMSLEIGYAYALGIPIVFADDFCQTDERSRYFDMARACATCVCPGLPHAITALRELPHDMWGERP